MDFEKKIKLSDGSIIHLRPIHKEDIILMDHLFHMFSEETIYHRFFGAIKEMPIEEIMKFVDVDYWQDMAVVAELLGDKCELIGVVRYMGNKEMTEAEFAIVISDRWQGKGLGREMFNFILEIAHEKGFKKIFGLIYKDNKPMISIVETSGYDVKKENFESDILKVIINLERQV